MDADEPMNNQDPPATEDTSPEGGGPAGPADSGGVEALQEQLARREAQLAERDGRERALLERYREALAGADPLLTVEDIPGESLEEVERNYHAARELLGRARDAAAQEQAPVPAGSPGRDRAAPVTPFEKIRDGLSVRDRAG